MIARHGTAWHVERLVRHYRSVKRKEALKNGNRIHEITPDTTVTLWRGEQMDEQMAVEGLLRRGRKPDSPGIGV